VLSKILEKIVAQKWVMPHVCPKIHSSQFAYVPGEGKGTVTALTLLHHDIVQFLDSSGAVRILSIDFAKAFDKILHSGILKAIMRFDLPHEAVCWISNFLSDRYQRVKVKGRESSWKRVISGVPQGSVLGPILFCAFIDSFHSLSENSTIYKYADDIHIVHFVRKSEDDKLQQEYDNILNWSSSNMLPMNETKCRVLDIITKKSLVTSPVISPVGHLPQVSHLRILGVTFSSDLKWNTHIETVLSKANKRLYLIRNLKRSGCPPSSLLLAYTSIIRPIILYAYPCYCNLPIYLRKKILGFERRVFRIVGNSNDTSIVDAGESSCETLFSKVSRYSDHCLRRCFALRLTSTRKSQQLRPVRAKTVRLSRSFTRFAR